MRALFSLIDLGARSGTERRRYRLTSASRRVGSDTVSTPAIGLLAQELLARTGR